MSWSFGCEEFEEFTLSTSRGSLRRVSEERETLARDMQYAEKVQLTVEEQLLRAEANDLFKSGDFAAAADAYKEALAKTILPENKLALISNLALTFLKLGKAAEAAACVATELMPLGQACFETPALAVKACARRLQACRSLGDEKGERTSAADACFFLRLAEAKGSKFESLDLPPADSSTTVEALLMSIGQVEDESGLAQVRAALGSARAESCDEDGMNALALSIHIESMRPSLEGALLSALLESGVPPDCRHEGSRTALMLAANEGRADLCERLLAAGANAACTDGRGLTALHAACVDLCLADEREEANLMTDPPAVVSLLLAHGAPLDTANCEGKTALDLCADHRHEHQAAEAVAVLLEAAGAGKTV